MRHVPDTRARRAHYRGLCEVVRSILLGSSRPAALRAYAALAIQLANRLPRPEECIEGSIPWNLALGS